MPHRTNTKRTFKGNVLEFNELDLLHYGHINLLTRAKKQGDYLVVTFLQMNLTGPKSKRNAIVLMKKLKHLLEAIHYVDLVIPENEWEQKVPDISLYQIDTFVMGDDWAGKFDFIEEETAAQVVYLPQTPEISTTQIKKI
ncbi:adenylyltransferase/cytidyltransferase family protein [Enterococcus sp.]|uniref:adenylyltransferase/cytidyltransferase family protein n=1 Tax=Enterococcus sp. TaxID=35783 RepID=UPI003C779E19